MIALNNAGPISMTAAMTVKMDVMDAWMTVMNKTSLSPSQSQSPSLITSLSPSLSPSLITSLIRDMKKAHQKIVGAPPLRQSLRL